MPLASGHEVLVIDGALVDPEALVELAAARRAAFIESPHNAYPGPELRLTEAESAPLAAFFDEHLRARVGARRTLRHYARLSMATRNAAALEPRQWIAHRDRLDDAPDRLVAACVLYLFRDERLGGTAFFAPRHDARDTAIAVHESGVLDGATFAQRYGITPGYPHAHNDIFARIAEIPARWNRLVVYDGGALFHGSAITRSDLLRDDPRAGRLTLNGFFVCRARAR
jgi:hypothetical protein